MPYRLLALDIDGTLLDEKGVLRDTTRRAVRGAAAAGMAVVLCSGRSFLQARPLADALDLAGPMVLVGGATSRHSGTGEVWHAERFDAAVAGRLVELIRAERMAVLATVDPANDEARGLSASERGRREGAHGSAGRPSPQPSPQRGEETVLTRFERRPASEYVILRGEPADALDEERMSQRPDVFHFTNSSADLDLTRALRITVTGTAEHFARAQAALQRAPELRVRHHVIRAPDCRYPLMEIYPTHVHKWSGVCRVAERLGVEPAEIVAVGDDLNDLEMVSRAALGVAMGNAVPRLKAAAKLVAAAHADDGLARFIAEHLLPA
jgi:hypothetical protein